MGAHGDRIGVSLALETGLESGKVLADFLSKIDSGALGASLNPGSLTINGFDPLQAVLDLGSRIKLVHAREFQSNGPGRTAREVPLGKGNFDWHSFMVYLDQSGYQGFLISEKKRARIKLSSWFMACASLRLWAILALEFRSLLCDHQFI